MSLYSFMSVSTHNSFVLQGAAVSPWVRGDSVVSAELPPVGVTPPRDHVDTVTQLVSHRAEPGQHAGLLNSRPKGVLAGRPAKSGRKWPKVAKSGQKWPKLNKAILKPLNHTKKVHNVTITYNTNIIFILVQYYFPQTPGRLSINTKSLNYSFSGILIHCTS